MIFTERTIRIINGLCEIDNPILLYRGDFNVEIRFTIIDCPYKYTTKDASNVIETTNASYGQLVIKTPTGDPIFSDVTATNEGAIVFTITGEMIDETIELGEYDFQIRLFDAERTSRATICPVVGGIKIGEPIAIEGGSSVISDTNEVNNARANYAVTTTAAPLEVFDSQGNYIETAWTDKMLITDARLNKIEDGITGVNQKIANIDVPEVDLTSYATKGYVDDAIANAQLGGGEVDLTGYAKTEDIPTRVSQLTNDANYVNTTQMNEAIANVTGQTVVEPAELDMPKVFFYGEALPTSKNDVNLTMDYISNTTKFSSYIKLKCQGTSSMSYAKKNFTIAMYSDEARETKLKKDFKGWGAQSKFCLKANYVDTTHTRNLSGARIAYDMVASRPDSAFKQQLLTAPRNGAVDGFPIKVYFNGEFYGIYTWNIPKDAWMFNMDESNPNHCVLCAERNTDGNSSLINSCQFRQLWTNGDGQDWSVEVGTMSEDLRTKFNRVIAFVMNATDQEFHDNIGEYFDLYSLLDYYCFSYFICHIDGLAKNMLMVTYDGTIWGASLYDMDSIYGANWQGTGYFATNYQCPEQYQERFSRLWVRIEQCFGAELYARYLELRQGALSLSNIIKHVEEIYDVIPDRVFTDEKAKWTSLPGVNNNTMTRFRNYMRDRAVYVDAQMLEIGTRVPCIGIVLSDDTLSFTTTATQTLSVVVSPSNCTDAVTWSVNPVGIATVNNGVVTPVANGTCTITATCGSYSDTCSVTVALAGVACTSITLDKTELALGVFEGETIDDSGVNYVDGAEWKDGRIDDTGEIKTGTDKYAEINVTLPGKYTFSTTNNYTHLKLVAIDKDGIVCSTISTSSTAAKSINVFEPCTIKCSVYPNSLELDSSTLSLTRQNFSDYYTSKDVTLELSASDINVRYSDSEYTIAEIFFGASYDIVGVNFNNTIYKRICDRSFNIDGSVVNTFNTLSAKNLVYGGNYQGKSYITIILPISLGATASEILSNLASTTVIINPTSAINEFEASSSQVEKLSDTITATVTPDNCTEAVVWRVSPTGIVTVDNGLVTAVANGATTVTATCGTQTATCAVTVSGIGESGGDTQ